MSLLDMADAIEEYLRQHENLDPEVLSLLERTHIGLLEQIVLPTAATETTLEHDREEMSKTLIASIREILGERYDRTVEFGFTETDIYVKGMARPIKVRGGRIELPPKVRKYIQPTDPEGAAQE